MLFTSNVKVNMMKPFLQKNSVHVVRFEFKLTGGSFGLSS